MIKAIKKSGRKMIKSIEKIKSKNVFWVGMACMAGLITNCIENRERIQDRKEIAKEVVKAIDKRGV